MGRVIRCNIRRVQSSYADYKARKTKHTAFRYKHSLSGRFHLTQKLDSKQSQKSNADSDCSVFTWRVSNNYISHGEIEDTYIAKQS